MFESILNSTGNLTIGVGMICMISALVMGVIISYIHMMTQKCSKNFAISLALLPLLVQVVILMVNGNLGTSVAILGAFSLIRFRSVPGTSKELIVVFFAMAVGLAIGMGQIVFAGVFTLITSCALLILSKTKFAEKKDNTKVLKITIPENLEYSEAFEEIFQEYLESNELVKVKTSNLGSMFELTYNVVLVSDNIEKKLIDAIRCRNGNLNISLNKPEQLGMEL